MPAYVIATVNVTDPEQYAKYVARTPATIAAHGGRFMARGGETVALEGPPPAGRVIILEFPSLKAARTWYASDEYQKTRELRLSAATGTLVAVEGV